MKLLFCERNMLMQRDMEDAFTQLGITFRCASYVFQNPDYDDYYCTHLRHFLTEDAYDAVFSINFIPVIADVCHEMELPYLCWNYDAGWEFHRTDALFYPTNYIFHFDKKACETYQKAGYRNIIHMPLAVNTRRLDAMQSTAEIRAQYTSDVTFLGSLYENQAESFPKLLSYLAPEDQTFFLNYCQTECNNYQTHTLWDQMTETYVTTLSNRSALKNLSPLMLICNSASFIANRQRLALLNAVAEQTSLTLYSTSPADLVPGADYRWRAGYYSQMPYIFRHSTINLNLTIPSIQTGIPLRIFDILGAGGFLLTNEQDELSEHFRIGVDLEVFHSIEELLEKTDFYLKHPDAAARIAQNGHEAVKSSFSFEQQFRRMLTHCGLSL
ncbi:MAG: DUF3880 domain-containing protein [Lachnospiraceae bacterium]|nr:DUF3880 domain-containing protein [Lachnospiraceae bacterium]